MGKVTLFDIGTRVPFLVRVPGLTEGGTQSEAMVELVDIYPTLVDVAGLEPPMGLQGMSLRPLLDHPERRGKKGCLLCCDSRDQSWGMPSVIRTGDTASGQMVRNSTISITILRKRKTSFHSRMLPSGWQSFA